GSSVDGALLTKRNVGPAPSSRKPKSASRRFSGGRRGNARMNSLNSDAVKLAASSNSGPARAPISSEALYSGPTATKKSRGSLGSVSSASARSPKRTYWGSPVGDRKSVARG